MLCLLLYPSSARRILLFSWASRARIFARASATFGSSCGTRAPLGKLTRPLFDQVPLVWLFRLFLITGPCPESLTNPFCLLLTESTTWLILNPLPWLFTSKLRCFCLGLRATLVSILFFTAGGFVASLKTPGTAGTGSGSWGIFRELSRSRLFGTAGTAVWILLLPLSLKLLPRESSSKLMFPCNAIQW